MKTLDYMRGWNDAISKMQEDLDGLPAIWKESMWHRLHHLRSLAGPISRPPTQGELEQGLEAAAKLLDSISLRLKESTPPEVVGSLNAKQYAKAIRALTTQPVGEQE